LTAYGSFVFKYAKPIFPTVGIPFRKLNPTVFNPSTATFSGAFKSTVLATGQATRFAANLVVAHATFAADPTTITATFPVPFNTVAATFPPSDAAAVAVFLTWPFAPQASATKTAHTAAVRKNIFLIFLRIETREQEGWIAENQRLVNNNGSARIWKDFFLREARTQ